MDESIVKRSKKDLDIIYYLSKKITNAGHNCMSCFFQEDGKVEDADIIGCNWKETRKGNKVDCCYDHARILHNTAKVLDRQTSPAPMQTLKRQSGIKDKEIKYIDNWKVIDFYLYYKEEMQSKHDKIIVESYNLCKPTFIELIKSFREISKERWRRLLKHYIHEGIKFFDIRSAFGLSNIANMRRYMAEYGHKQLTMKMCPHYEIQCPYWRKDNCSLHKDVNKCEPKFRAVFDKYN